MTAKLCNSVYRRNMQKRRESASRRGKEGNEIKARLRMERLDRGPWARIGTYVLTVDAAPDGRHVAVMVHSSRPARYLCGSERAVTAALRRLIYGRNGP